MNLPKELLIGTRTISVEMVSFDDPALMGQYDSTTQKILISKDMPMSQQIETLWHEMIHAIHDYNGVQAAIANEIAVSQYDGGDPDARAFNLEETLTNGFSNVLVQVITDNNLLKLTA